jgi:hypothetical protein
MTRPFVCACAAVLLTLAGGCSKKALQTLDASGGIGPIGGDRDGGLEVGAADLGGVTGAAGSGGAADASRDVPIVRGQSYVMTSTVTTEGGTTSHTFTLTLDFSQRIAVIGTPGNGELVPFEQTSAGAVRLRFAGTLAFSVPVAAACGGAAIYEELSFVTDASGVLLGTGRGKQATYDPSGGTSTPATMVLVGTPDDEAPALTVSASSDLADPWASLWIVASEPLPGNQTPPALRSASGDVLVFESSPAGDPIFTVFERPRRLLRFGEQYRITTDGLTDFAGNHALWTNDTTFTTRAALPLIAQDGFESVTDDTLGGAQVISGAGAPTIAGARSLYVPPAASLASGFVTQLAVRVRVPSGSTTLRFAYRFVNPGETSGVYYLIASVGGTIDNFSLPAAGGATTLATIGPDQVALAPTATASILLPDDARDEIVFVRIAAQAWSCGGPAAPPVPGIIIDDLRVE